MNRRRFLEATAGALAVGATQSAFAGQTPPAPPAAPAGPPPPRPAWSKKNAFKLKYAPHIGMFADVGRARIRSISCASWPTRASRPSKTTA